MGTSRGRWRSGRLGAYVLLAEPGGGKSEAFKREAAAASYVLARDFFNAGPPEGWSGEALFIDGFDQMRADSVSRDTPLDRIVQKLVAAGTPELSHLLPRGGLAVVGSKCAARRRTEWQR